MAREGGTFSDSDSFRGERERGRVLLLPVLRVEREGGTLLYMGLEERERGSDFKYLFPVTCFEKRFVKLFIP